MKDRAEVTRLDQLAVGDEVMLYGFGLGNGKEAEFEFYEGELATIKSFFNQMVTVDLKEEPGSAQLHRYQVFPKLKKRLL